MENRQTHLEPGEEHAVQDKRITKLSPALIKVKRTVRTMVQ